MSEDYGIKPGYAANTVLLTPDESSGTHYWTEARLRASRYFQFAVYAYAGRVARRRKLESLLDVGCGSGAKLAYLHRRVPELDIRGVDQAHAIDLCRATHDFGTWHVDDFEDPAKNGPAPAQLVLSSDVIEHLADPDRLLEYVRAKVLPGGYVILSTPERDRLRGVDCNRCPNPYHVREWSFREFEGYLESRGFRVLEHELQLPVRIGAHGTFYREVVRRWLRGERARTNQVCLLQPQ